MGKIIEYLTLWDAYKGNRMLESWFGRVQTCDQVYGKMIIKVSDLELEFLKRLDLEFVEHDKVWYIGKL